MRSRVFYCAMIVESSVLAFQEWDDPYLFASFAIVSFEDYLRYSVMEVSE